MTRLIKNKYDSNTIRLILRDLDWLDNYSLDEKCDIKLHKKICKKCREKIKIYPYALLTEFRKSLLEIYISNMQKHGLKRKIKFKDKAQLVCDLTDLLVKKRIYIDGEFSKLINDILNGVYDKT